MEPLARRFRDFLHNQKTGYSGNSHSIPNNLAVGILWDTTCGDIRYSPGDCIGYKAVYNF
jgi:hypothetical protein